MMCCLVLISLMASFLDMIRVSSAQFPLFLPVVLRSQARAWLTLPDTGYYFQAQEENSLADTSLWNKGWKRGVFLIYFEVQQKLWGL